MVSPFCLVTVKKPLQMLQQSMIMVGKTLVFGTCYCQLLFYALMIRTELNIFRLPFKFTKSLYKIVRRHCTSLADLSVIQNLTFSKDIMYSFPLTVSVYTHKLYHLTFNTFSFGTVCSSHCCWQAQ